MCHQPSSTVNFSRACARFQWWRASGRTDALLLASRKTLKCSSASTSLASSLIHACCRYYGRSERTTDETKRRTDGRSEEASELLSNAEREKEERLVDLFPPSVPSPSPPAALSLPLFPSPSSFLLRLGPSVVPSVWCRARESEGASEADTEPARKEKNTNTKTHK